MSVFPGDAFDWIDPALAELRGSHLERMRRPRRGTAGAQTQWNDNHRVLDFASNDYLGLSHDPRVLAAVRKTLEDFGWGSGASPLVSGHTVLHAELEAALANFEQAEAALLFPTGYAANVGAITALAAEDTVIFSDAKNHASIIDGCRLSRAPCRIFRHGDASHLGALLEQAPGRLRKLVVTDGLFSMDGDMAPLREIAALCDDHGAMLLVDEAHATGVLGPNGGGACDQLGCDPSYLVRVGTLSKALGSLGGFVVGPRKVIQWLTQRSRPLIYSTGLPPAHAAAGLAALDIVQADPQPRQSLLRQAVRVRQRLQQLGWNTGSSRSQIIPVLIGDPQATMCLSAEFWKQGIFVPGIRPPSVPAKESLLRISLSSDHTPEMIDQLIAAFANAEPGRST